MRVLTRYLVRDYLTTFFLTVTVFTFVMTIGSVVQIIDLMSRGVGGELIFKYFGLSIPYVLQYTVPMAALTTALLLFTRLSLDGEVTALKASGVSLWGIVLPVLVISLILSVICFWLTGTVSPQCRYTQRKMTADVGDTDPLALLEEGRFTRDFPGHLIYIGKRNGNEVDDLEIYQLGTNGISATVRARHGRFVVDRKAQVMRVDLYDARIERSADEAAHDPSQMRSFTAEHYPETIDLKRMFKGGVVAKKRAYITTPELLDSLTAMDRLKTAEDATPKWKKERMDILVELTVRRALSMGCFGFTLLGIPLGIHSRRKESSMGVGISLGIISLFYFIMPLARAMTPHPEWMPELIVWLPLFLAEGIGVVLIHRAN